MAIRNAPNPKLTLARKKELLRELDAFFQHRIRDLFDLFFDESEFRLFQHAQRAESNQRQTQLLETLAQLKRNRRTLEDTALRNLHDGIGDAAPETPPTAVEQLALIETDVLEAQLTLETSVRKADQRWFEPLYCLAKRYSQLHGKTIDTHDLPMGVVAIGRAMDNALQAHIPLRLLPLVLQALEHTVLQQLGDVYDALNAMLKQAGVLPNLEIDLWRELHQAKIGAQRHQATPVHDTAAPVAPAALTTATQDVDGGELFSAARQILELMHPAPGADASVPIDDREAVLALLARLQHEAGDAGIPLAQRLRDAGQSLQVGASADSLRFIDALFSDIEAALRNSPALIETLRQLRIPLAQAAVQQPELLGDNDNPVHQFVNLLMALTAHADLPNAPLEQKLSGLLQPIGAAAAGAATTGQLFAAASAHLTPLLSQQDKARERNIRRIVDTYEGQQRLARAHAAVDRELQRRNANAQTPVLALRLLEQGLRHILTLTYVRKGDTSAEWSEYFALLDELLWRLGPARSEPAQTEQARGEAGALADRIAGLLDVFFPGEYRNAVLVDELRRALLGAAPVATEPTPWQQTKPTLNPRELQLELDQAYPHLVRWFRRARDLKAGDQFVHFRDTALRERYTLVWIAENQQHFVFVNARGHKVFDFDLVDLANEMARGLHLVGGELQWPALEQAMLGAANDAYQQLAFNSTHDELTGLLNRKEFEHQLANALLDAKNQQLQHALLYIDIDQFSLVNNLLGHVEGDKVLARLSRVIAAAGPAAAQLARTAGNEFAVLIRDCDIVQAQTHAENIRRAIAGEPYVTDDHKLNITASIGVIAISKYIDGTDTLLRDAVAAATTAKEQGRNRVCTLQTGVELHTRREKLLTWIDKMSDLLHNDYLVLRAQPILPTRRAPTAAIEHYEILLGLRGADGIVSPPGEFIEAAECYNRMQRVDRWVIERAFAWLAGLAEKKLPVPQLSINLSGNSLNDATFLDFLVDQFGSHRVAPATICFEITETATIRNLTNAADFIQQVKNIGCSFALDDFGTGLSSYEYLKHLPVDYLKIDGMFIVDIANNPADYAMVKSINEIAHFMGKKTIAEFVQDEATIRALEDIGIDYLQGFHLGHPQLLEELSPTHRR